MPPIVARRRMAYSRRTVFSFISVIMNTVVSSLFDELQNAINGEKYLSSIIQGPFNSIYLIPYIFTTQATHNVLSRGLKKRPLLAEGAITIRRSYDTSKTVSMAVTVVMVKSLNPKRDGM